MTGQSKFAIEKEEKVASFTLNICGYETLTITNEKVSALSADEKTKIKKAVQQYDAALTAIIKDPAAAIMHLTQAINIYPAFCDVYVDRGILFLANGEYLLAKNDFSQAILLESNVASKRIHYFYMLRGDANKMLQDYQAAIDDYSEFIRLNPNDPVGYCRRGAMWQKQKKFTQAGLDYVKLQKFSLVDLHKIFSSVQIRTMSSVITMLERLDEIKKVITEQQDLIVEAKESLRKGLEYKKANDDQKAYTHFMFAYELDEDEEWRSKVAVLLDEVDSITGITCLADEDIAELRIVRDIQSATKPPNENPAEIIAVSGDNEMNMSEEKKETALVSEEKHPQSLYERYSDSLDELIKTVAKRKNTIETNALIESYMDHYEIVKQFLKGGNYSFAYCLFHLVNGYIRQTKSNSTKAFVEYEHEMMVLSGFDDDLLACVLQYGLIIFKSYIKLYIRAKLNQQLDKNEIISFRKIIREYRFDTEFCAAQDKEMVRIKAIDNILQCLQAKMPDNKFLVEVKNALEFNIAELNKQRLTLQVKSSQAETMQPPLVRGAKKKNKTKITSEAKAAQATKKTTAKEKIAFDKEMSAKKKARELDEHNNTALLQATANNDIDAVAKLIEAKVNLNVLNKDGLSPVLLAAKNGRGAIAKKLIEAGAYYQLNILKEVLRKAGNEGLLLQIIPPAKPANAADEKDSLVKKQKIRLRKKALEFAAKEEKARATAVKQCMTDLLVQVENNVVAEEKARTDAVGKCMADILDHIEKSTPIIAEIKVPQLQTKIASPDNETKAAPRDNVFAELQQIDPKITKEAFARLLSFTAELKKRGVVVLVKGSVVPFYVLRKLCIKPMFTPNDLDLEIICTRHSVKEIKTLCEKQYGFEATDGSSYNVNMTMNVDKVRCELTIHSNDYVSHDPLMPTQSRIKLDDEGGITLLDDGELEKSFKAGQFMLDLTTLCKKPRPVSVLARTLKYFEMLHCGMTDGLAADPASVQLVLGLNDGGEWLRNNFLIPLYKSSPKAFFKEIAQLLKWDYFARPEASVVVRSFVGIIVDVALNWREVNVTLDRVKLIDQICVELQKNYTELPKVATKNFMLALKNLITKSVTNTCFNRSWNMNRRLEAVLSPMNPPALAKSRVVFMPPKPELKAKPNVFQPRNVPVMIRAYAPLKYGNLIPQISAEDFKAESMKARVIRLAPSGF